jgi:hypothetical protein
MRGRQLTLVSHGVLPASVADLEGVLLGPGQLARMGGTARLSVVVPDRWRQAALLAAFAERGLPGEPTSTEDGRPGVRTPFLAALGPAARRWARGAVKAVPEGFTLDGQRLRLWAIAAGRGDGSGYLLALGVHDDPNVWSSAGTALRGAGLPATFLQYGGRAATNAAGKPVNSTTTSTGDRDQDDQPDDRESPGTNGMTSNDDSADVPGTAGHGRSADAPAYRVTGRRRLARLAELVGDPPPGAQPADWPT